VSSDPSGPGPAVSAPVRSMATSSRRTDASIVA
jgi:hypothetical protein